ncbi:hypothetical protein BSX36_06105 [Listeria monocytogenes]|nr:hypothetical protein [Listeria monocytogenes]EAE8622156.1 hypothetical protein [Listeria monocytogenes]EAE8629594.1 hypothetical protein [Listeria monocytogenes]EAE8635378.1 hypothetical protein [Listeria monocytogenes]EAE8643474.1 hypothetical protein [Listeria monocytogenes]
MTENLHLESLKAIDGVNMDLYKEALDVALQNENNTNIALSGSYGSGKSSIIESYKKQCDDNNKFLHISLGQYDTDMNNEGERCDDTKVKEKEIEGKIINQLLHQINTSQIPQTIFKVKRKTHKMFLGLLSGFISVFLVLLTYIINFNRWSEFLQKNPNKLSFLAFTTNELTLVIAIVINVILVFIFTYKIVFLQHNKGIIKKLSVKGYDFEIMAGNDESYFDKFLNDVIYLFENAGVNIIVFEDIDRFNNGKIFGNLKEINTLVNNRKKEGKLVFLYLLRDDIFTSKDRTKFFDLIIPVVPVIDASNSYEKFIEIFKKGDVLELFNLKFLQKLSLYVDDMRLLKNIYNEFVIYQREVDTINLDCDKLLALITYKNIFPRDFANLQLSKGFVYSVFGQKEKIIDKKRADLKNKLLDVQTQIDIIAEETLESLDELDALSLINPHLYTVNYKNLDQFESVLSFVKELKKEDSLVQKAYTSGMRKELKGEDIASIFENSQYINRKFQVQNKKLHKEEVLENKKEKIIKEIEALSSYRLEKFITNENIDSIVQDKKEKEGVSLYKDIEESNYYLLLVFLIKNGYIDESYAEYMTYFYDHSITLTDKLFLRSITDEKPLDWFYDLNNISQIIDRMEDYEFSSKEAWNADLLKYMLEKSDKYNLQLQRLIVSLSEANNLEFFKAFFIKNQENGAINETFLEKVFTLWDNFAKNLLSSNNEINISILKVALGKFDKEVILKQNTNDELTNYLNTAVDFLPNVHTNSRKTVENLIDLRVKFTQVEFQSLESEIAKDIYEGSLYEINMGNLSNIIKCYYGDYSSKEFKHKNYTLLKNKEASFLLEYINCHINAYMLEYMQLSEGAIEDSENYVIQLVNNEEIEVENRLNYIEKLKTKISDITTIRDKNLWKKLIENDAVLPNEVNVVEYYRFSNNKWNEELVDFVNRSVDTITINLKGVIEEFGSINLFSNTINTFTLNNNKYITLVDSMKKSYSGDLMGVNNINSYDIVPHEKIILLIDNQIIHMSDGCLAEIREFYPEEINHFIKQNLNKYLELIQNTDVYDDEELLGLLEEPSDLDLLQQKNIVMHVNHPIAIAERSYSFDLINFILEQKFDINDLSTIIDSYGSYPHSLQKTVVSICITNLDEIFYRSIDISDKELVESILKSNEVTLDRRQNLFSQKIACFRKDEIKVYISNLKIPKEFTVLLKGDGGWPKVQINDVNKRILDYFKTKNWVTSFVEKKGEYEARGKKIKKEKI